ncbi:hypothetical protein K7432_002252 [Basidiobolus ranarum]|uniref:NADH dehydrogenase [ubiquinone] 1 beta subcomplex subunit 2 n=1 Tax=Basidiobolus ranarum TaxID=34480 RepID=A0ABR2W8C0_9FUNG
MSGTHSSSNWGAFNAPHAGRFHRYTAKLLGATMWFFMMYRAKQDGLVTLRLQHPWDAHGHGEHKEHH